MIQTLPLTQHRWPPNHPSASRQLAPFTLAPAQDKWTLKLGASSSALSAAVAWPSVQNALAPSEAWRSRHDLALAALSLPGLVLGATADTAADSVDRLPVQYRHDLPYTDELEHAGASSGTPKTWNAKRPRGRR